MHGSIRSVLISVLNVNTVLILIADGSVLCMRHWTRRGLERFYPLITARTHFYHKIDRHLLSSVRAPWENGKRSLRIPVYLLNVLLALDTAASTLNFLHCDSGGPIPDCESLQLEDEHEHELPCEVWSTDADHPWTAFPTTRLWPAP